MGFVRKDKTTLRDHLQTAANQGSVSARLQLIPPEVSDLAQTVVGLYYDIAGIRGSTGFGPQPIQYQHILQYQQLRGVIMHQWQIDILLDVEMAYLRKYDELAAKHGN